MAIISLVLAPVLEDVETWKIILGCVAIVSGVRWNKILRFSCFQGFFTMILLFIYLRSAKIEGLVSLLYLCYRIVNNNGESVPTATVPAPPVRSPEPKMPISISWLTGSNWCLTI